MKFVPQLLKKNVRFCIRTFWATVLFTVIAFAVFVQIGRLVFPYLDEYKPEIEALISNQIAANVEVGEIHAEWTGLRPRITFRDIVVSNTQQELIFDAEEALLEISLLSLVHDWRLALRKLSFTGLKVTFVQDEDGLWSVRGLKYTERPEPDPNDDADPIIDDPLDIFLFGRRLDLKQTNITFLFDQNVPFEISVPGISLDNDDDFHRLSASLQSEQRQDLFKLVIEAYGDPRDDEGFDATTYVKFTDFPTTKVWPTIKKYWSISAGKSGQDFGLKEDSARDAYLDMEIWASGTPTKGLFVNGLMSVMGMPFEVKGGQILPQQIDTQVIAKWDKESGWDLNLPSLAVTWPEFSSPNLNVSIHSGPQEQTQIGVDRLDVNSWVDIASRTGWIAGRGRDVLGKLAPRGLLKNVSITLTDKAQGYFRLKANASGLGVSDWRGAPAIKEIYGYVEASAFDGKVILKNDLGFEMAFPKIYHDPLVFDSAYGEVRWSVDTKDRWVGVSSGLLSLNNEAYEGRGHFNLRIPIDKNDPREQELTIVVGVDSGPVSMHEMLVPFSIPDQVYSWVHNSLKGGQVSESGFIYHGTVEKNSDTRRVVQLLTKVKEASIQFDPKWPELRDGSASFYLNDATVQVTDIEGDLAGNRVHNGRVTVPSLRNNKNPLLKIRGRLSGDSQKAMSLLAQSPVNDLVGESILAWQVGGKYKAGAVIDIPLSKNKQSNRQEVKVDFLKNNLSMPDLKLAVDDVQGQLRYSNRDGFKSTGLKGVFQNEQLTLDLKTHLQAQNKTIELDFDTVLDVRKIEAWLAAPTLLGVQGKAKVDGAIRIPYEKTQPITVTGQSDLLGVSSTMPEPLTKTESQPWNSRVAFTLHKDKSQTNQYVIKLADELDIRIDTRRQGLHAVSVGIGEAAADQEAGKFKAAGVLDSLDLAAWADYVNAWRAPSAANQSGTPATYVGGDWLSEFALHAAVSVKTLSWEQWQTDHVSLVGNTHKTGWELIMESEDVVGRYHHYTDGTLPQLTFDRIYLPEIKEKSTDADAPELAPGEKNKPQEASFHPKKFPAMLFKARNIRIGEKALGSLSFKSQPMAEGVLFSELTADIYGLKLAGKKDKGAELIWLKTPEGEKTYFTANAKTEDIGQVIERWGQEKALTSKDAEFDLALEWQGEPFRASIEKLIGKVDIQLDRGRFIRGASAAENPLLKLIGLLNFDTLARRLRLDFSDLNPQGMAYERLRGTLAFREGMMHFEKPLKLETPSSDIEFSGRVNLKEQSLDARVLAILPVTGNLTMAAAVTGGIPAAVGVFLAGKIFKEQVDKIASLNYTVNGPWADPNVSLEKATEIKLDSDAESKEKPVKKNHSKQPNNEAGQ